MAAGTVVAEGSDVRAATTVPLGDTSAASQASTPAREADGRKLAAREVIALQMQREYNARAEARYRFFFGPADDEDAETWLGYCGGRCCVYGFGSSCCPVFCACGLLCCVPLVVEERFCSERGPLVPAWVWASHILPLGVCGCRRPADQNGSQLRADVRKYYGTRCPFVGHV